MRETLDITDGVQVVKSSYKKKVFVTILKDDEAVNSSTMVSDVLLFEILKELQHLNRLKTIEFEVNR